MAETNLTERLLALNDVVSQRQLLREHATSLDGDEVARGLKAQADQYLRADIRRAVETADLLLFWAELSRNPRYRALGLLAQANALSIGLGEYEQAIQCYDEAAHLYERQGDRVDQARSQIGKVAALANLGRYHEALQAGEWASVVLEEQATWPALAALTLNIAVVYGRAGDDARSLAVFDRAAALYRQLGEEGNPAWLWVQQSRAVALRNLGRFGESIQASQIAWEGLMRLGQRVEAARASQGLALTFFVLGRYNEALTTLDQVRDIFFEDGRQRDAMLVELFTSDCLLQLRRFNEVLEKCRQVRRLFADLGMRHGVAEAIRNEARAYAELARFDEALSSLAEARQIFAEEGNEAGVATTDLEIAGVLGRDGRHEESLALANHCAAVFRAHELPVEEAQAELVAARAAIALGRFDEAFRGASMALATGEQREVPALRYRGYYLLGLLSAAGGDPENALAAYDRAIQEVERLRGRLMVEFRVGFVEDKAEIYENVVGLCLDLDQPARGLQYAERAKSRALLDLLAYRLDLRVRARDENDAPLVKELEALRAERDRLYRRWESDSESGQRGWTSAEGERSRAQQGVLALETRITELWHRLLMRNADYAREAALDTPADASLWDAYNEPVQSHLLSDTVLVEFFALGGKAMAFVVTADTVEAVRLEISLPAIQTLMQLLWLNLGTVPKSDSGQVGALTANAQGLLQRLYSGLLAPLGTAIAGYQRLVIVPHGPLHYLPFHALHDGRAYLCERHEISYLPGASLMGYCRQARPTAVGLWAVGHSYAGRLPYAVEEARGVAALLNGETALEEGATLDHFRRLAGGYRALHLAAHGDFRPDNPLFSGLALADGWLTTLDIFNLRLDASLVTLSACQTGRNVIGGGDELLGLTRAFLYAGAASLVLSLWAVEDRSTARFMQRFYGTLAEGWTKGAALRHAQLAFLHGRDEEPAYYGHPYFWAPFYLVGDAGPL